MEEYESLPTSSPRMSSYRSNKPHRVSTAAGGSIIWKRPPNETYEQRKERILRVSLPTQESQIDFSNVKVEKATFDDDKNKAKLAIKTPPVNQGSAKMTNSKTHSAVGIKSSYFGP